MIRCIVFDFDGTLVDSNSIKHSSFLEIADGLPGGAKVMSGVIDSLVNATRYEIFDRFLTDMRVPQVQCAALSREYCEKYSELCHAKISKTAEIPGAQEALKRLRARGICLFVSSATPNEPLLALIRGREWDALFQGVYGAPESKQAHIAKIMREGGWSAEEMVYVGDSDVDMVAATESGCTFIGVCIEGVQGRFSIPPEQCVTTLAVLPGLITSSSV